MNKPPSAQKTASRRRKREYALLPVIYLLIVAAAIFYVTARYKQQHFEEAQIDEIVFYYMNGLSDGQSATFVQAAQDNLLLTITLSILLLIPVIDFFRHKIHFHVDLSLLGRARTAKFNPSNVPLWLKFGYAAIVFTLALWYLLTSFGVRDYLRAVSQSSQLFEQSYVDPKTVEFEFPERHRNLVYIYLESLENTLASRDNGGQAETSLIPELESLALDQNNVSFSHRPEGIGGPLPVHSTTWTVAAMTAQMGGVPLKVGLLGSEQNTMGDFKEFLPGAVMIGDILRDAGYNQSFIMGSRATFGGRDKLLQQHGDYHIIDLTHAREQGLIPPDYHVWWGYEDRKLFEFARAEAVRLAESEQPFNLQLLTVDTHFSDGYLDPTCPTPHVAQYDNVYACSSARVAEFINWIRAQPFADNTTIVIAGDHLGMQSAYYDAMMTPGYTRSIYNVIINPAVTTEHRQGRLSTAFDLYPTTLAAIGVQIPGNRLALGTNLFSGQQTLLEQYGSVDALNAVLSQRSHYYERQIRIAP